MGWDYADDLHRRLRCSPLVSEDEVAQIRYALAVAGVYWVFTEPEPRRSVLLSKLGGARAALGRLKMARDHYDEASQKVYRKLVREEGL